MIGCHVYARTCHSYTLLIPVAGVVIKPSIQYYTVLTPVVGVVIKPSVRNCITSPNLCILPDELRPRECFILTENLVQNDTAGGN